MDKGAEAEGGRSRGWKRRRRSGEETPAEGRGRGTGMAGRKGVARNILASPRAPSCVLNHFPVDSAVCNPIIGVSPPGKLLFYSRTTRAPDVPCTAIFSLFLSLPLYSSRPGIMSSLSLFLIAFHFPRWFHSFPAQVDFNPVRPSRVLSSNCFS